MNDNKQMHQPHGGRWGAVFHLVFGLLFA